MHSSPHPAPKELQAYRLGELSPEDEERLRDHLTRCRLCVSALLDLEELAAPDAPSDPAAWPERKSAAWRALSKRLKID